MIIQLRLLLIVVIFIPQFAIGQTVCSQESRDRLDTTLLSLSEMDATQKTINEAVIAIGTSFLNTPYVEKTLEVEGDERLVINLIGLDCTTFLESVITFSRLVKLDQLTYEDYEKNLELLRYRDGKRNGYSSRLHYFSDWIYNNQKKGILTDITADIGGVDYENHPSFMSQNPKFYPQLANEEFIDQIKKIEAEIKSRTYHYIPKEYIESHEVQIKSGDLIAITISMDNLDISHVGVAIQQSGRIHLLHASTTAKKVVISEKPLSDYLMGNKSQSGIMVCRLIDSD